MVVADAEEEEEGEEEDVDEEVGLGLRVIGIFLACPVVVAPPQSEAGTWEIDQDGNDICARFLSPEGKLLGFVLTGQRISEKQALSKEAPALLP